jgi:hypothetical protein
MKYLETAVDIVSQILEVANNSSGGGATKNRLMYEYLLAMRN